jgi:hypothetical protein
MRTIRLPMLALAAGLLTLHAEAQTPGSYGGAPDLLDQFQLPPDAPRFQPPADPPQRSKPLPDPLTIPCTSTSSIETMQRIVQRMKWPLGGDTIKVLKFYNFHANPNYGKPPSPLTDTASPCAVSTVTDRGEFGFTYRWKRIDGDLFMLVQIDLSDND